MTARNSEFHRSPSLKAVKKPSLFNFFIQAAFISIHLFKISPTGFQQVMTLALCYSAKLVSAPSLSQTCSINTCTKSMKNASSRGVVALWQLRILWVPGAQSRTLMVHKQDGKIAGASKRIKQMQPAQARRAGSRQKEAAASVSHAAWEQERDLYQHNTDSP